MHRNHRRKDKSKSYRRQRRGYGKPHRDFSHSKSRAKARAVLYQSLTDLEDWDFPFEDKKYEYRVTLWFWY